MLTRDTLGGIVNQGALYVELRRDAVATLGRTDLENVQSILIQRFRDPCKILC